MMKINSLVFAKRQDAEIAIEKLRKEQSSSGSRSTQKDRWTEIPQGF